MNPSNSYFIKQVRDEAVKEMKKAEQKAWAEGKSSEEIGKIEREVFEKKYNEAMEEVKQRGIREHKKGALKYRDSYKDSFEFGGIDSKENYDNLKQEALEDYKSGKFFMERIGRIVNIDIKLGLILVNLREAFIRQEKINTAPEYMLLDMAMLSYFHAVRINELIGNFEASIEWDYFFREKPLQKAELKNGQWLEPEYLIERLVLKITENLLPKLDQFNRMLICNLKAIRDHKRITAQLNIASVGQLNIGNQQINTANLTQEEKKQIETIIKASQERQKNEKAD